MLKEPQCIVYTIVRKKKYTSYVTYKNYKYSIPNMYFKKKLVRQ